ncbi:prepilin peptidase [Lacticaseibacillus zhaodongensis]|uniref:prepilin peptidase n=1 Tax=Lacticaseibacillus zhaodongensis TaxID=2668065 RepID=UPI0012D2A628|nr:prepilin peptidase [Lacticaseibacillus zhaodongensis]
MTMIISLCYFCGLTQLALEDAQAQSVPAPLCDIWTAAIILLAGLQAPAHILPTALLCFPLALAAYYQWGLGSADVCAFAATGAIWGPIPALCVLLLASLAALTYGLLTGSRRLAFLPYLLLGSTMVQILLI